MKLIIGIPIYIANDLHLEFTVQTIGSINTSHEYELVLVENYVAPEFQKSVDELPGIHLKNKNNCVSTAWNMAIEKGITDGADYILLPNNDIVFRKDCIDNLVKFAQEHTEFQMWTAAEFGNLRELSFVTPSQSFDDHPHFSCFMISPNTVEFLKNKELGTKEPLPGLFDPNYTAAYFEDNDMHNRILRAGGKAGITASALFYHFGSRTIKVDDELNDHNRHTYEHNRKYFQDKWGFDPHNAAVSNEDPIRFARKGPFEYES